MRQDPGGWMIRLDEDTIERHTRDGTWQNKTVYDLALEMVARNPGHVPLVFGERAYAIPVSALKSQIGHLLGGSGGVETIAAVQTIRTGMILPTLNLEHPGEGCDLDYVPLTARHADVRTVVKNSFGFGGQNAVLVLRRFDA